MITTPPLVNAAPGDPITAEAWNAVIDSIGLLVADANLQRGALIVAVRDNGNPLRGATVTTAPGDASRPASAGVFAGGDVHAHRIEQLPPGAYDVILEADGY